MSFGAPSPSPLTLILTFTFTAVDYFSYLYPDESVDRVFAVVYMLVALVSLLAILFFLSCRKASSSDAYVKINLGLFLFVVALLVVPIMDVAYIKGKTGLYDGFYVIVGVIAKIGLIFLKINLCSSTSFKMRS